jgi:hypothetical protein
MPRRRKPPGRENWTWAEIEAGRRFSKAEKRAERLGDALESLREPDGTRPGLGTLVLKLLAIAVLIPLAAIGGPIGLLCLGFFALVLFSMSPEYQREMASRKGPRGPDELFLPLPPETDPPPPRKPFIDPIIGESLSRLGALLDRLAIFRRVGYALSFRWVALLPDWLQPILWGLGITLPVVLAIAVARGRAR